jgi:hypothetical protein
MSAEWPTMHDNLAFAMRGGYLYTYGANGWMTRLPNGDIIDGVVENPDYVAPEPLYKRKLFKFPVMWSGWECDDEGWVVEMADGSRALLLTDHTAEYIAKPKKLREKIREYKKAIAASEKALAMLR